MPRGGAGHVSTSDVLALKYALSPALSIDGMYAMSQSVGLALESEHSATGQLLSGGAYDADRSRILGRRHQVADSSPAIGNDADVVYGAWRYYFLVIETSGPGGGDGIVIQRSAHCLFRQNRTALRTFVVVGGLAHPNAFAILVGPESAS